MSSVQLLFWGFAALLASGLAALLVWLLRNRAEVPQSSRQALNIAIYQERMAATDDPGEAQQRLLEDAAELTTAPMQPGPLPWPWTLLLALAAPMLAIGLYLTSDAWRLIGASEEQPPLDYVLHQVLRQTQRTPEDAGAWLMLGRVYRRMALPQEAVQAYARANRLDGKNADALVEEGELLASLSGGRLDGKPLANFEAALKLDPRHAKALFLTGLAAYRIGNGAAALKQWQVLAAQPLPPELAAVLKQKILELGGEWPEQLAVGVRLATRVQLDPTLSRELPPGAALFVYAQNPDGPRRPLAVKRGTADRFPQLVQLTDADAVMGGTGLSGLKQWRVVARISASGDATPQSGDLYGEQLVSQEAASKGEIVLTINQRHP